MKLSSIKNYIITKLSRFITSGTSYSNQRILIVSTTALGDSLWATPTLINLRKSFPLAHIAVLTSPVGSSVFQNNPHINEILVLHRPFIFCFFSLFRKIKKAKFGCAIILHASQRLVLPLCRWSGIPRIIGFQGQSKDLDHLLTDSIPFENEHAILRRERLIQPIGATIYERKLSYFVEPKEKSLANDFLRDFPRPYIIIHPGSKDAFRRYPLAGLAEVAEKLHNQFHGAIFLTGNDSEMPLLQTIHEKIPSTRVVRIKSIRFLGALIEEMDLILCHDTGPLHLSCALRRPSVSLFVPSDPKITGPLLMKEALVIQKKAPCTPCLKRKCRDPFCFQQISVDDIFQACSDQLRH